MAFWHLNPARYYNGQGFFTSNAVATEQCEAKWYLDGPEWPLVVWLHSCEQIDIRLNLDDSYLIFNRSRAVSSQLFGSHSAFLSILTSDLPKMTPVTPTMHYTRTLIMCSDNQLWYSRSAFSRQVDFWMTFGGVTLKICSQTLGPRHPLPSCKVSAL